MCHEATRALRCHPSAVGGGRRFVRDRLNEWGVAEGDVAHDSLDGVLLATSELLGNAIRHCTRDVGLAVAAHRDEILVSVTDDHPDPVRPRHVPPDSESGRGMLLVETVSTRWGQQRGDGGKTVWCSFAVGAGSALADGCSR
jgi:anti-sigma regulatory factor (Ser/Thr protein kinase)